MDALARLAPVARDVLDEVDTVLETLGAPSGHLVWELLRSVGAGPGAAADFFAAAEPAPLRALSASLRGDVASFAAVTVDRAPWQGAAGEAYAEQAAALRAHLVDGTDSLAGRLGATASYVDDVADWWDRSRDRLARVLADVLSSAQVVTLRATPALVGPGRTKISTGFTGQVVVAAADIGAHVLAAAVDAQAEGEQLVRRWEPRLSELTYLGPVRASAALGGHLIDLRQ